MRLKLPYDWLIGWNEGCGTMSFNVSQTEELINLKFISEDHSEIEKLKLSSGDRLIRSAVGESIVFTNGVQVMIRPGYFSLSSANGVTIEKGKGGLTALIFANGEELNFNEEGIQSLRKGKQVLKFSHLAKPDSLPRSKSA